MLPESQSWIPGTATFLESRYKMSSSIFYHQHPNLGFVFGSRVSGDGEFPAFSGSFSIFGLLRSWASILFEGGRAFWAFWTYGLTKYV